MIRMKSRQLRNVSDIYFTTVVLEKLNAILLLVSISTHLVW